MRIRFINVLIVQLILDPEIDRVAAGDRSASISLDSIDRLDLDRSSRLDSTWARIDRLDRLIRLK